MEKELEQMKGDPGESGEMLHDIIEEIDMDPDDLPDPDPPRQPTLQEKALTEAAMAYCKTVDSIFKDQDAPFHQFHKKYIDRESQIPNVKDDEDKLLDAISVIDYYRVFIYVKCKRATTYHDFGFVPDPIQNDNNGSAKVALMACRRSIQAWSWAQDCLPDSREIVEKVLSMLVTVEALLLNIFPKVEEFVRPGFDD